MKLCKSLSLCGEQKIPQRLIEEPIARDLLRLLTNGLSLIQNRHGFITHFSA